MDIEVVNTDRVVRAALVKAGERELLPVVIHPGLDELRQMIGGGWLEAVRPNYGDKPERYGLRVPQGQSPYWHAYCDEEGKLKGLQHNSFATIVARGLGWANPDVLFGDVVFLGDGPEGEEDNLPDWCWNLFLPQSLPHSESVSLSLCTDCVFVAAYGPQETDSGLAQFSKAERLDWNWGRYTITAAIEDSTFSWSNCDGCGDHMAGDRYAAQATPNW